MMPFYEGQIDVGEFVYDGDLPAMRATVYGLESGAADVLITEAQTYLLTGPHDAPTGCKALGRKLLVPSTQWLSDKAVCVGRTQLDKRPVRLWKTPGFEGRARWHWFNGTSRLPSRSLFLGRAADPAIIGDYAMTYFSAFTPVGETKLAALRDLCVATAKPVAVTSEIPSARELMAIPNRAASAERAKQIAALIPGLSHEACSGMKAVRWDDRFVMTATITPTQFDEDPYLSLIYYDWNDAATQLAIMMQGTPPKLKGLVSLKKGVGYRIERQQSGGSTCRAVFPGMVRPDWMSVAGCKCKGVIDHNAALNPDGQTQILSCPIKHQDQRVMWNWYTAKGHPIMFVEAAARGGGVMLADYHDFLPGETGKPADFDLPKACFPEGGPKAPAAVNTLANPSCSDCHTAPH